MAWIECRKGSWRVLFRYAGKKHTFLVGEVKEREAQVVCAKADYWLMRLKQKLVHLPAGCDIVTFVEHDGKPPEHAATVAVERNELTLGGLRQAYFACRRKSWSRPRSTE